MEFRKAERKQTKLRLAMMGPSSSGKTFSSLLIASGLGERIAVIDTENHTAEIYEGEKNIPSFDVVALDPPYTMDKYLGAIRLAIENKYDVLVIDSISHAWAGEGGLLEKKNTLDATGRGNSYVNWAQITKEQELFKSRLLHFPEHLIVTMRSKQEYVLETNERGKQVPRKVGLAPIQREGLEYEFLLALDMDMDHMARPSKTKTTAFDDSLGGQERFVPSRGTGESLLRWLNKGVIAEGIPIPRTEAEVVLDEIFGRLTIFSDGDRQKLDNTLMQLTEHEKEGQIVWFSVDDLKDLVYAKPEWIFALKAKMDVQKIGVKL